MTRETKIGLLVGLAFIIVIGILLSDQRRGALDPVPANLALAGSKAGDAVKAPGSGAAQPPLTMFHDDPAPHGRVATSDEMRAPAPPVVPTAPHHDDRPAVDPRRSIEAPSARGNEDHGADGPGADAMSQLLREHSQDLVRVTPDGRAQPVPPPAAAVIAKAYKAQSGDTVSRMAGRFMGANNLKNRQAIIDANPSLQDDPDNVIIGRNYVIPGATAAMPAPAPTPVADAPPTSGGTVPSAEYYTVEQGDTLWGIATDEVGDSSAVAAIKELNKNVLRGENHDVVRPGMKLRLPGKSVASAN